MSTALTQAIVRVHATHVGLAPAASDTVDAVATVNAVATTGVSHLPDAGYREVFRAAWAATRALGFIQADAQALAAAWQRRAQRLGRDDNTDWPDDPADFGLAPAAGASALAFTPTPQRLGLYAVLPSAAWVGRLAQAGVPTLQLRFKSGDAAAIRAEVRAAVAAVQGTPARLFINDHWQDALAAGAYGVHLGQEDLDALPADTLPTLRQAGLRLGLSTHGYAEMLRAAALQPSYIALGAVFPTTLKAMPTAPQGLGRLAHYVRLLRGRSLVAIGGIDAARLPEVLATGVGSVAVVRALLSASKPEAEAAAWMRQIDSAGQ